MKKHHFLQGQRQAGFTLVEMIVSLGLFAIVMVVSIGALLAITTANRKAQALQSVMNNLNITIDSMVRNLRMGSSYQCITSISPLTVQSLGTVCDGTTYTGVGVQFKAHDGTTWIYELNNGAIQRSKDGGATWQLLTAPEVIITTFNVYVVGATKGDVIQPKVLLVLKGVAGSDKKSTTSSFHIQAMALQRVLDI